jgi:hypothetical protein
MRKGIRALFWGEIALASLTAVLFVITLAWHNWVELLFEIGPDGGDGSLEWGLVTALFVTTASFVLLAVAEWRRIAPEPTS